jgi:hypothetical protein
MNWWFLLANASGDLLTTYSSTIVATVPYDNKHRSGPSLLLGTMEKKGFSYPSKCLTLSVKESGGDTTANSYYEHSIHECNIRQLPYFETLLSERWSSREDQNNELLHF